MRRINIDYFHAMESLLYNYRYMQDAASLSDVHLLHKSDCATLDAMPVRVQYAALAHVVQAYSTRREFTVIKMRYFGQGMDGAQLPLGERYTWEQIADALSARDMAHDERTARRWRNQIVGDMAVCLFGAPAALSVNRARNAPD